MVCAENTNTPKEKKSISLDKIIPLILSFTSLVTSIILTIFQITLTKTQNNIERLFNPINYTISISDKKFIYHFGPFDVEQNYPQIKFTTGSPTEIAIIISKTNGDYIITSQPLTPKQNYVLTDIQTEMPRTEFDYSEKYAYDYFFLYLEDANGTPSVDLIFYQIDLIEGTVSEPNKYTKVDLIRLDSSSTSKYEKEMLNEYKEIINKINELK